MRSFRIMEDKVAEKVIEIPDLNLRAVVAEKAQGQGKPKPEQRIVKLLHEDPQMRQAFFAKISAPIVNKMFDAE